MAETQDENVNPVTKNDKNKGDLDKILHQIDKNKKEVLDKMAEKMDEISDKIDEICEPDISVRDAIIGEWQLVFGKNFEDYTEMFGWTMEDFTQNVKFEFSRGKLRQSDGTPVSNPKNGNFRTFYGQDYFIDRFMEGGGLWVINKYEGKEWTRFYEKI